LTPLPGQFSELLRPSVSEEKVTPPLTRTDGLKQPQLNAAAV